MKFKNLALLALTTCTLIVLGTGIVRAAFTPKRPQYEISQTVVTQSIGAEETDSLEIESVNQATLEHLQEGRQELAQLPSIRRTTVKQGYAIATWIWGEAGGQSVLSLTDESWTVIASGGGAVDLSVLEEAGVPTNIAEQLIESDQAAWEVSQ